MGRGNYVGRKGVVLTGVTVGSQRDRIFVIKFNLIRYNRSTRRSFLNKLRGAQAYYRRSDHITLENPSKRSSDHFLTRCLPPSTTFQSET